MCTRVEVAPHGRLRVWREDRALIEKIPIGRAGGTRNGGGYAGRTHVRRIAATRRRRESAALRTTPTTGRAIPRARRTASMEGAALDRHGASIACSGLEGVQHPSVSLHRARRRPRHAVGE